MKCSKFRKALKDHGLEIRVGSEMDLHMNECDECAKLWSDLVKVSSSIRDMERQPAPPDFDARLNEKIIAHKASMRSGGIIARLADVLSPTLWVMPLKRRYAPFLALMVLFAVGFGLFAPQLSRKGVDNSDDIDWRYIKTCQDAHFAMIQGEPLISDSTAILKSQVLMADQEL